MEKVFVSVPEAAHAMGLSVDYIYDLINDGKIPAQKFGRRKLIPIGWLHQQSHYVEPHTAHEKPSRHRAKRSFSRAAERAKT